MAITRVLIKKTNIKPGPMPRPPKCLLRPASTISSSESAADDGLDYLFEMTAEEQKAQEDAAAAQNARPVPVNPQ
jgi:hypothetical protein